MSEPTQMIEQMKAAGKLKALPIKTTDKRTGALIAVDGTELCEFWANDSTWVPAGGLENGTVRYLGSSTHAGHIELKALYVMCDGIWYNILTGKPDKAVAPLASPMLGTGRQVRAEGPFSFGSVSRGKERR